ncbi:hypothetical protein Acr_14g0008220 [Actinidia rufa]|uniref:Uncharacterized protein n=1 Tax=Actinidia rufa TaxID=165716 RepID=A0A7J0FRZ6_9ERIC|nr:hypothetical protein Acr_14g0008220 [Actinidia rufa]
MSKRYSRAQIGLAPVLFPSSSSRYCIVFCDVDRHRDEQPLSPPVCLGSVVTHRGYARWMFRLHISTSVLFYRAVFPTYGGAVRLPRLWFVPLGAVIWMPSREKEIAALRPLHHFRAAVIIRLRVGRAPPSDTDMALNRAQMLVRDSEALAQFRVDHRIPDDVVIERPGPNDDADWVEGEGDRMPIRTWFIYQAGLRFPLSKLLRSVLAICGLTFMQVSVNFVRTVLAVEALMQREGLEFTTDDLFHVYCVVKPRKNPETQMLKGNHYLRLRKPNQPQMRIQQTFLEEERPVFGCNKCSRKVSDLLGYIPLYRYTIPLRTAYQGRPVLPPLQIRGPGSRPRSSLSDEDIDLGDEALNEEAEVEDGEEVDQIPPAAPLVPAPIFLVPKPINLPSSDSDVAIVEPREIVEHSYSHSDSSSAGSQLNAEVMAPKVRILGKKQAPTTDPPTLPEAHISSAPAPAEDQSTAPSLMGGKRKGKQPAEGTSRPKRGKGAGSAAGTPELWAPQFSAVELGKQLFQRAVSSSLRLKQGVVDLKKANQKASNLEKELKQTQSDLADARSAAESAILQRNHAQQLAELRPGVFQEGWLACLKELQIPLDHPAWSSPAPPVQLPVSPERYSPIHLPDFNEEEYATLPAAEGNTNAVAVEAQAGAAETADRDRAGEAEGDRALEAKVRYSARARGSVELASPSPSHSPGIEVLWRHALFRGNYPQDLEGSVEGPFRASCSTR